MAIKRLPAGKPHVVCVHVRSYGDGGLARGRNINWPKRPEDGLVFTSKNALKNPLSPKRELAKNMAAEGTVEFPCTKDFQRVALSGRTVKQYTAG